jgi:hypothetical protein
VTVAQSELEERREDPEVRDRRRRDGEPEDCGEVLFPGFGTDNPDSALPANFARGESEATQLIPLAALIVIGVLFYVAGRATRQQMVSIPLEAEAAGEAEAAVPA